MAENHTDKVKHPYDPTAEHDAYDTGKNTLFFKACNNTEYPRRNGDNCEY